MPDKATTAKARRDLRRGKRPTTAAGEFVRKEIEHIRKGKHGARSTKQAIAIGLSQARRAGIPLPPRPGSKRHSAGPVTDKRRPSRRRQRATLGALRRERHSAASRHALSMQARSVARRRSAPQRSKAARAGAKTKGPAARSRAAHRAASTRAKHR